MEVWCSYGRFSRHLSVVVVVPGLLLLEELVQNPDIHVRAWKLDGNLNQDLLRDHLLHVRNMGIFNVLVMASREITNVVLDQV